MKRVAVCLPDDILVGLRKMAAGENRSVASLIREAVDRVYGEDIEDIRDAEEGMAEYRANPASFISLEEFVARLEKPVATIEPTKGKEQTGGPMKRVPKRAGRAMTAPVRT